VDRNRLKRRLREVVRLGVLRQLPSVDLVIRVSPAAYEADYEVLAADVANAGQQVVAGFRS
jgi:ribonuclease P protein component